MKILVSGGAGFIGSNLCIKLMEDSDNEVWCMDNLYTGNMRNLASISQNSKFHFVNHDIIDPLDIAVDQIYNAACPASPPAYQKDPVYTMQTNVYGMKNMLDLANRYHARIMQFSTSEVYGDALVHPQTEEYWGNVNPNGIRSCYDEGKRTAEALCFDYHRTFGTDIRVIRIFNTYGPHMNPSDGRVISNFVNQAMKNRDITVYGNGEQTRSFCYVDDLVNGIIKMMNNAEGFHGPVNLGNPDEIAMRELAEKIIEKTASQSRLAFCDLPADDPRQRRPDISKAKCILGWVPSVELSQGLDKVIEYYTELIK